MTVSQHKTLQLTIISEFYDRILPPFWGQRSYAKTICKNPTLHHPQY